MIFACKGEGEAVYMASEASSKVVGLSQRIFNITGPSGVGKTEIAQLLHKEGFVFLKKSTTRPLRRGEIGGVDLDHVTPAQFDESKKAGDFLDVWESRGHYYGLQRASYEDTIASGSKDVLVTSAGYNVFDILQANFRKAIRILISSSIQEVIPRKLGRDQLITEETVLQEFQIQMERYREHYDKFTYIIQNPSPFGFALAGEYKDDHLIQIGRAAKLVSKCIEWERSLDPKKEYSTEEIHKNYIYSLFKRILETTNVAKTESRIRKGKNALIEFSDEIRDEYSEEKGYMLSMIPRNARVIGIEDSYGVKTVFLDETDLNSLSREIVLGLIEKKVNRNTGLESNAKGLYAKVADQSYGPRALSSFGRLEFEDRKIYEGGIFTLREYLIDPQPGAPLSGLNIAFLCNGPESPPKRPRTVSLEKLSRKAKDLISEAKTYLSPATRLFY